MSITFISYDGCWPNLCSGTLVFDVDGKTYRLNHGLCSGGCCWIDEDDVEYIEDGPWIINELPDELEPYRDAITAMVNENVEWGCCGGCI